jgi:hypothetical protein
MSASFKDLSAWIIAVVFELYILRKLLARTFYYNPLPAADESLEDAAVEET